MGVSKDTILRSTINDYFENEPYGRLTAWVYPPAPQLPKTLPLWQNGTPVANLPSSNFEIGKLNTPTSQFDRLHECLSLYYILGL